MALRKTHKRDPISIQKCDIRSVVPKAKGPETGLARSRPIDASKAPGFEDAMLRPSPTPGTRLRTAPVLASSGSVQSIGCRRSASRVMRWPVENPPTRRALLRPQIVACRPGSPSCSSLSGGGMPLVPWPGIEKLLCSRLLLTYPREAPVLISPS
jgi:hypothetical protein